MSVSGSTAKQRQEPVIHSTPLPSRPSTKRARRGEQPVCVLNVHGPCIWETPTKKRNTQPSGSVRIEVSSTDALICALQDRAGVSFRSMRIHHKPAHTEEEPVQEITKSRVVLDRFIRKHVGASPVDVQLELDPAKRRLLPEDTHFTDPQGRRCAQPLGCLKQVFGDAVSEWDVSFLKDFSELLVGADLDRLDLRRWDVSGATTMHRLFAEATGTGEHMGLSEWEMSTVTDMSNMFENATEFCADISNWTTTNVVDASYMFAGAEDYNGDLRRWNMSACRNFSGMFQGATTFSCILSGWRVPKAMYMDGMFDSALGFDCDISSWDLSGLLSADSMLRNTGDTTQETANIKCVVMKERAFLSEDALYDLDNHYWYR